MLTKYSLVSALKVALDALLQGNCPHKQDLFTMVATAQRRNSATNDIRQSRARWLQTPISTVSISPPVTANPKKCGHTFRIDT